MPLGADYPIATITSGSSYIFAPSPHNPASLLTHKLIRPRAAALPFMGPLGNKEPEHMVAAPSVLVTKNSMGWGGV